jgi:hypothetical protein
VLARSSTIAAPFGTGGQVYEVVKADPITPESYLRARTHLFHLRFLSPEIERAFVQWYLSSLRIWSFLHFLYVIFKVSLL